MLKVTEIFHSIQGEGYNTGLPVVFIRLAECNLSCPFCDTDFRVNFELDEKEIIEQVKLFNCDNTIITGGEPLLQNLDKLIEELKGIASNILLETNGTIDTELPFDWITISPKAQVNLKEADEAKIIVKHSDTIQEVKKKIEEVKEIAPLIYLQPCWDKDMEITKKNIETCVNYVKEIRGCRLSLQTQKLIGIR